jgi:acyl carrier protein
MLEPSPESNEPPPSGRDEIQLWLVAQLAKTLGVAPASIDVRGELATLGLDSLQIMSLLGEAEDFLECRLPEDIASDAMTVEELAAAFTVNRLEGADASEAAEIGVR